MQSNTPDDVNLWAAMAVFAMLRRVRLNLAAELRAIARELEE